MNALEKQMFRHYLYARVNEYYMFKEYRLAPGETYKDFKINLAFSRLGLPEKHRSEYVKLIRLLSHVDDILSVFIILFRFLHSLFLVVTTKNRNITNKKLVMGISGQKVNTLFKQASIDTNDICVVTSPYCKSHLYDKNWGEIIPVHSNISVSEVVSALYLSLRMTIYTKIKFGKRDCLFRSYSAFEYFLCYYFFIKINSTNTAYYISINDRWAYLFGHLNCKTVFLQHGALNKNKILFIMSKIGRTDIGYYINDVQREICNRYMFSNVPIDYYFTKMEFTSNDKLLRNGKKNVLLVCELIYYNREKEIIEQISSTGKYNLYVKPHPQNDPINYLKLQEVHKFTMLGKIDYPAVDYVISYDSTLVLEYQSNGIKTLMYEDDDYEEEYKRLIG